MGSSGRTLEAAITNLTEALAHEGTVGPGTWAARLEIALAGVVTATSRHDRNLEGAEGGVVDVGSDLTPSPGMDRRLEKLHLELESFRQEAAELRDLLRAAQARGTVPEGASDVRKRAECLLATLQRYEHEEGDLVQDSTSTDIGAGD